MLFRSDREVEQPSGRIAPFRTGVDLDLAVETGCLFSIDTDAHAPGQLDWQVNGCERAAAHGVPLTDVVNTWTRDDLVAWAADHSVRPAT